MRLIFVSNVFPSAIRPTKGVFNLGLVRALAQLGHSVDVVSPIAWTDWWRASREKRKELDEGEPVWREFSAQYPLYFYPPGVMRAAYGQFMWWGVRSTIRAAIQRTQPDAVISYWVHPDGGCAVRAAKEVRIPAVVISGGSDVLLLRANNARRRRIEEVLHEATAIVTVSDDIRRRLVDSGIHERKISVVRRGVDTDKFTEGDRQAARSRLGLKVSAKYLLWVGRVEPVKGLSVLLAALQQLKEEGVDFQMLLIGSGGQSEVLEAEARRRDIDDRLNWLGVVSHERLPDYYRAVDLTILPSLSEGVPNVLLESIACGTPFVASDVGGIPEIATVGRDRLVEPKNAMALACAIREKLSGQYAEVPARFVPDDWPTAANRLIEVIQPLVANNLDDCVSKPTCLQPSTV